jgi:hypothetical protein
MSEKTIQPDNYPLRTVGCSGNIRPFTPLFRTDLFLIHQSTSSLVFSSFYKKDVLWMYLLAFCNVCIVYFEELYIIFVDVYCYPIVLMWTLFS